MGEPLVYTPDNEPYLGLQSLLLFDLGIVDAMEGIGKIAPTGGVEYSDLQKAAIHLTPSGVTLALSIRELVRQGYLYGALALTRPLLERSVTLRFLWKNPEKLALWNEGWPYDRRPRLWQMIKSMDEDNVVGKRDRLLDEIVHGSPAAFDPLSFVTDDGKPKIAIGRNLNRPDICDKVSDWAASALETLMDTSKEVFVRPKVQ